MVWYSHLLKNFPPFVVIHRVKGFGFKEELFLENVHIQIFRLNESRSQTKLAIR